MPEPIAKDSWFEGIQLVQRKLAGLLESFNVQAIPAVGEEFDPNLDIRTETEQRLTGEASPVRIFVNVGGTLTYPEVTMSSDPVYSEADILSILVTGRSSPHG